MFIETLNGWGERWVPYALDVLWQSSLLIVVLLVVDLALRNRVRAGLRYAVWMLLPIKLLLPPSLAVPTGVGYWIDRTTVEPTPEVVQPVPLPEPDFVSFEPAPVDLEFDWSTVPLMDSVEPVEPNDPMVMVEPAVSTPTIAFTREGVVVLLGAFGSLLLLAWMVHRWIWVNRIVRKSEVAADALQSLGADGVPVRLTDAGMSPAVCGLFRPVVLLPRLLVERLTTAQLRTVIRHEMIHLRRGDLWVNCLQTLLQIAFWWHPLLWWANTRIRQVREEAVDEAVASENRDDLETYPNTLLEVAKLTFKRPLVVLGLIGIVESKSALKQRIHRLLERTPADTTGIRWWQWGVIVGVGLICLPMAEGTQTREASLGEESDRDRIDSNRVEEIRSDEIANTLVALTTPNDESEPQGGFGSVGLQYEPPRRPVWRIEYETDAGSRASQLVGFDPRLDSNLSQTSLQSNLPRASASTEIPKRNVVVELRRPAGGLSGWSAGAHARPLRSYYSNAQASMEIRQDELFEQDRVPRLWDFSPALLEHPYIERHVGEYGLHLVPHEYGRWVPSDWSALQVALQLSAQELDQAGPQLLNSLSEFEQVTAEGWDVLTAMKEKWGGDPFEDVAAIHPKEQFMTSVPILQLQMELEERQELAAAVRSAVESAQTSDSDQQAVVVSPPSEVVFTDAQMMALSNQVQQAQIAFDAERERIPNAHPAINSLLERQPDLLSGMLKPEEVAELGLADQSELASDLEKLHRSYLRLVQLELKFEQEMINREVIQERTSKATVENQNRVDPVSGPYAESTGTGYMTPVARVNFAIPTPGTITPEEVERRIGAIEAKLDRIRLQGIGYDEAALVDVLRNLIELSAWAVPEGDGVVFSIFYDNNESFIKNVKVTISPTLENVRLREVLDAIVASTEIPLEYSVEYFGVVFQEKLPNGRQLHTRNMNVDLHTLYAALRRDLPDIDWSTLPAVVTDADGITDSMRLGALTALIRLHLGKLGADISPPAMLHYNDRTGRLMVTASQEDLEIVQRAIEKMNDEPLSQTDRLDAPISESVRRDADMLLMRQKLTDAKMAQENGDLIEAAQLYQQCFAISRRIGRGIEVETAETIKGLVEVQVELARQLRSEQDFVGAAERINSALLADPTNAELIALKNAIDAVLMRNRERLDEVRSAWVEPFTSETLPESNPDAYRDPPVATSAEREAILEMLKEITFAEVSYERLPLSEVLKILTDEIRFVDPEKKGVNLLFTSTGGTEPRFTSDPVTGAPVEIADSNEGADIGPAVIDLSTPLRNVRAIDVLDAIVMTSDKPIKYSVENYGVVFSPTVPDTERLFTRSIKVNPNTFYQGLEMVIPEFDLDKEPKQDAVDPSRPGDPFDSGTNGVSAVNQALKAYFAKAGVDFDPPKMMYFNSRTGLLLVRATLEDLENIQRAVEVLNYEPPQVTLEARVFEVPHDEAALLGLDWMLGRKLVINQSPPEESSTIASTNSLKQLGMTGILGPPEFKVVLAAFEQRVGIKSILFPRVTTLHGRQTRLSMINVPGQLPASPEASLLETVQVIDIIPYVSSDGHTIRMSITPQMGSFTNKLIETNPAAIGTLPSGNNNVLAGPIPELNPRQVAASAAVWDGHTVVLNVQEEHPADRSIVVFITPTLIDPAGNVVNDPNKLPIAPEATQTQPTED